MGRKPGINNMTIEMLKEQKRKRDAARYALKKDKIRETNYLAAKNAAKITCGCGGHYKDLSKNKYIHVNTKQHILWEEEERLQIRKRIIDKYDECNTIEEANNKLLSIYELNDKYRAGERLSFLADTIDLI